MKFQTLKGWNKEVNLHKYKIKWESKSLSLYQKGVKDFLKKYWLAHIVCEEFPVPGTRLRIDILNVTKKLALEIDGEQHDDCNHFFHGGNKLNYLNQFVRDKTKNDWCSLNNITLLRITPKDLPLTLKFFKDLDITL